MPEWLSKAGATEGTRQVLRGARGFPQLRLPPPGPCGLRIPDQRRAPASRPPGCTPGVGPPPLTAPSWWCDHGAPWQPCQPRHTVQGCGRGAQLPPRLRLPCPSPTASLREQWAGEALRHLRVLSLPRSVGAKQTAGRRAGSSLRAGRPGDTRRTTQQGPGGPRSTSLRRPRPRRPWPGSAACAAPGGSGTGRRRWWAAGPA